MTTGAGERGSAQDGLFADDPRLVLVIVAAGLGLFMVALDFFAVQAAVPSMAADFDTTTTALQWVLSGYMLALSAMFIVGGRLADIFGRRRWLIIGMAIFGATSLLGGASQSAEMIIVLRILQGIGAAIVFPVSISVVTTAFPARKVERAVGLAFAVMAIGQGLGPFAGGAITEYLSWRWVLWLNVPVALIVIVLVLRSVAESRDESAPRTIDWAGLVLIIASVASFTYGIDRAADDGWTAPTTVGLIAAGLVGGALFLAVESRVRFPLLDLRLFRIRRFSVMTGAGAVGNAGFGAVVMLSMLLLQNVRGLSAIEAGLAFLPFSLGTSVASLLSGRLGGHQPWAVMATALTAGGLGTLGMGLSGSLGLYLVCSAVAGFGIGLAFTYANVVTQTVVPPGKAGAASGAVLTVLVGAAGVAIALSASLVDTQSVAEGIYSQSDIEAVLVGAGILIAAAAPLVALLGRERAPAEALSENAGR